MDADRPPVAGEDHVRLLGHADLDRRPQRQHHQPLPDVHHDDAGAAGAHTASIGTNGSGQITSYRQTGDNNIGTRTVTYTYPSPGAALGAITDATHAVISFGYDGSNNLTDITVTGPGGDVEKTHIDYDAVHRGTAVTRDPGGSSPAVTRFSYPSNGPTLLADPDRSTGSYAGHAGAAVPHTTYNYDTNNLRATSTTAAAGHSQA